MEARLTPVRAEWQGAVLVCGKCSKKAGGGFGGKGRTSLAKALRKVDGFGKGRKAVVGVAEVKCLGLCPGAGVTVVDTRRPGEWLVDAPGEDVMEVATRLQLPTAVRPE